MALRRLAGVGALALLVAACAGAGDDGAALGRRTSQTTAGRSPASSSPSLVAAPTTTTASPPTSVAATAGIVLGPLGIGVVDFGTEATVALSEIEARLGPPVDDRPLGSCPSGEVDRLVQFAELSVLIAASGGTPRFVAWDLGPHTGALPRLATAEGISVGSTLSQLRAAYGPRLELSEDDPFGPGFEVEVPSPGRLGGTLTGTSPGDTVATLSGGSASCGA